MQKLFGDFTFIFFLYLFLCNKGNKEATTNRKSSDICETSDILLWAIFANRKEIAEICWIRGENHLRKYAFMFTAYSIHKYIHVETKFFHDRLLLILSFH